MQTTSKSLARYYIFITISMLFWGMSFIWSTIALEYFKPIALIFFRLVLSSVILYSYIRISGSAEKIHKEDGKWFFLLALAEPFFYFLGENFGLLYVSPAITSAIIATIPLFSAIVAFILLREKIEKLTIAGIFISFSGIIFMLVNRDLSLNASLKGVLLLFLAVFSAVAYSFFIRKLANKYKAVTILTWQNIIGSLYFLPLFLIFDLKDVLSSTPSTGSVLAIVQLSIFASGVAFLLFIVVVAKIGMVKANIFTNLIPVFTGVFSYFIIGEIINLQKVVGILMVVGGIVISQMPAFVQVYQRNRQKRELERRKN